MKKILSFALSLALMMTVVVTCALPASAVQSETIIGPGENIEVPAYTYYQEYILRGFEANVTYDILLGVPHPGSVLIQTFGSSAANAPKITLLDSNASEVVRYNSAGFKNKGYRSQTLVQAGSDTYTLRLTPIASADIRLSVTVTEQYFDADLPIDQYEDINYSEDGIISGMFYYGTSAMVSLYQPTVDEVFYVTTEGSELMEAYIFDPRSTDFYGGWTFDGCVEDGPVFLDAGVPYYLVLMLPIADPGLEDSYPIDSVFLSMSIRPANN